MRKAMVVSQLRTSDVTDPAVVAAMAAVPREDFVPEARRETAYVDRPIPLGTGRSINPPLATGRILTVAEIDPATDKVLLLGDATGYCAALLDHMGVKATAVGEGAKPAGMPASIAWVEGDPAQGNPAGAPYDVIVIDGGVETFPDALDAQLAEGGRVALGLVRHGVVRLCAARKAGGVLGFVSLHDMEMAMVPGFASKASAFVF